MLMRRVVSYVIVMKDLYRSILCVEAVQLCYVRKCPFSVQFVCRYLCFLLICIDINIDIKEYKWRLFIHKSIIIMYYVFKDNIKYSIKYSYLLIKIYPTTLLYIIYINKHNLIKIKKQ